MCGIKDYKLFWDKLDQLPSKNDLSDIHVIKEMLPFTDFKCYETKGWFDIGNTSKLKDIRNKYQDIPLGLSEEEREEFLKSTPERKLDIKDEKIEDILKLRDSQEQSSLPQPVTPAAPFLPDPQIANMFAANINPTTGLTQTESALLSPEEQIIAQRLKT